MRVEGRRIEPGFCPQCNHVQEAQPTGLAARCAHCGLPLRLLAGRFRIVEQLNEGNFAWIYRALDITSELPQECAIKVFKAGMLDEVTEKLRFRREVHVTRMLATASPHIVHIFDIFGYEQEIGHFYVMEMLRGMALDELLMEGTPLGASLTFHLAHQLCEVLSVAHKQGVFHRDLKPENIFLAEQDGEPYFVKLIDFGIAKHEHTAHHHLTQEAIGTPLYMSPEQCQSLPVDGRTDIYALGILLYRCLTGQIPFVLDKENELSFRKRMLLLMRAHIDEIPRPMSVARPDLQIHPDLDRAVLKAISKDPDKRYPTTESMWQAIAPFAPQAKE